MNILAYLLENFVVIKIHVPTMLLNDLSGMAAEVVYYSSAFNLDPASHYSYFGIPELERVVYTYLNVVPSDDIVDMFYTTERAKWMD